MENIMTIHFAEDVDVDTLKDGDKAVIVFEYPNRISLIRKVTVLLTNKMTDDGRWVVENEKNGDIYWFYNLP